VVQTSFLAKLIEYGWKDAKAGQIILYSGRTSEHRGQVFNLDISHEAMIGNRHGRKLDSGL